MRIASSSNNMYSFQRIATAFALLCVLGAQAFTSPASMGAQRTSRFMGSTIRFVPPQQKQQRKQSSSTSKSHLTMFLGTDGGILGVGTPEVFTILLVGYFVLGPSDLYKLVKEIGKFIQNFRTLGAEATKTFENTMETQLELEDLRKAQRELNDAFSFRRSINVDQDGEEAFAEPERGAEPIKAVAETEAAVELGAGVAGAAAVAGKPKKRIRRRKKKAPVVVEEEEVDINGGNIPDLDMSSAFDDASPSDEVAAMIAEEDRVKAERLERLTNSVTAEESEPPSWFDDDAAMPDLSSVLNPEAPPMDESNDAENNRFSTQLTDDWNAQIMANEDKLGPLAQVMERLAILEEEKNAADARLEEEFLLRTELEEKYYREKRNILEEAAAEVQANAYVTPEVGADSGASSSTETV